MYKKILIIFLLLSLTNCSAPGSALLGPVFTGATTKSTARATLSFTSNQIVKNIHTSSQNGKNKIIKVVKNFEKRPKNLDQLNFHN